MSIQNHTYGLHAVFALLTKQPQKVNHLYLQKDRRDQKITALLSLAKTHEHIVIHQVSANELDKMTNQANHQGVVAIRSQMQALTEEDLKHLLQNLDKIPPLLLVLDGVQDPHNLGACFRSAEAAGVHALIVPKDKSVGLTATVAKVASGAAETVPFVQVTNLARTLTQLKQMGVWVFGADMAAKNTIYQQDLTIPLALVLGAEGKGLRRLTRDSCDDLIKIPMQGELSSLNVSVATGICLFEAVRQRKYI